MTRPSGVIERPALKFGGALLSVEKMNNLLDVRVETTVSRPAQASLRFFDREFDLLDDSTMAIGGTIEVGFIATGVMTATTIFLGEITSLGVESGPDDTPITVVTAHDLAHRLGRNSRQRVFAQQTYKDMVTKIAGENGLRADIAPLTIVYEHMTQYVDDGAFVDEICRRCGLIWQMDGHTLKLREAKLAPNAVATLDRGETLRRFRAQFDSAEVADQVEVRSWDPKSKQQILATSSSPPASLSSAPLVTSSRRATTSSFRAVRQTGANVTASTDEATLMAESLHARSMGDELRVRGEADGDPKIVAGATIEINRVGTKLTGKYFVTSAEHVYSGRDYVTRFSCGGGHPAKLADLVGARTPPPQRIGALIGVVTNVGKDEFAGLVKVKLPTVGADLESAWARVVTPGGGSGRGLQLMPSVNDEVLVVFENGDMSRPFVLGGLWNPRDHLPFPGYVTNSEVTEWTLRDRGGHSFSFRSGDADTARNVELKLADGKTKLFVGQDKVELWAAEGKPLQLKSGQGSITITANGDIEIKGNKVSITATQDLTGKGMKVELTADTAVKVQANTALELKASASAKLDGGGMTEVKGGIVKIN